MAKRSALLHRCLVVMGAAAGVLLAIIGIRYLVSPQAAARTFGVSGHPARFELHHIIGLRNVWLGVLAVGCVVLRQWRALSLWFAIGTTVCFADAAIAASSSGRWPHIAFHVGCGLGCIGLAIAAWGRARLDPRDDG